jgi:hypothetical protein
MNEHADLDLIAAFREGLLDPADGDRVGRHLSDCPACAQRQSALDEVTARLAQAPAPPLPPTVARRLEAALASEVAAAETATATPTVAASTVSEQRTGRGHRTDHFQPGRARAGHTRAGRAPDGRQPTRRGPAGRDRPDRDRSVRGLLAITSRPLAAVAAVCLLAGGGYLLVHSFTHNSARVPATAPNAAGSRSAKSGAALSPRRPMIAPQNPTGGAAIVYVRSGTSYEPGVLRVQAAAVARSHAAEVSPGKAGDTTVNPSRQNSSLSGCVRRVTGGQRGVVVDTATYQGRQATVIIAPGLGGAGGQVWVVGPQCSAANADVITTSSL